MKPNDEFNNELLTAYFDGELSPSEQAQVEQLLFSKPEYRVRLLQWRELRSKLQNYWNSQEKTTSAPGLSQNPSDSAGPGEVKERVTSIMREIRLAREEGRAAWPLMSPSRVGNDTQTRPHAQTQDKAPLSLGDVDASAVTSSNRNSATESGGLDPVLLPSANSLANGTTGTERDWRSDYRHLTPQQRLKRWRRQIAVILTVASGLLLTVLVSQWPPGESQMALSPDAESEPAGDVSENLELSRTSPQAGELALPAGLAFDNDNAAAIEEYSAETPGALFMDAGGFNSRAKLSSRYAVEDNPGGASELDRVLGDINRRMATNALRTQRRFDSPADSQSFDALARAQADRSRGVADGAGSHLVESDSAVEDAMVSGETTNGPLGQAYTGYVVFEVGDEVESLRQFDQILLTNRVLPSEAFSEAGIPAVVLEGEISEISNVLIEFQKTGNHSLAFMSKVSTPSGRGLSNETNSWALAPSEQLAMNAEFPEMAQGRVQESALAESLTGVAGLAGNQGPSHAGNLVFPPRTMSGAEATGDVNIAEGAVEQATDPDRTNTLAANARPRSDQSRGQGESIAATGSNTSGEDLLAPATDGSVPPDLGQPGSIAANQATDNSTTTAESLRDLDGVSRQSIIRSQVYVLGNSLSAAPPDVSLEQFLQQRPTDMLTRSDRLAVSEDRLPPLPPGAAASGAAAPREVDTGSSQMDGDKLESTEIFNRDGDKERSDLGGNGQEKRNRVDASDTAAAGGSGIGQRAEADIGIAAGVQNALESETMTMPTQSPGQAGQTRARTAPSSPIASDSPRESKLGLQARAQRLASAGIDQALNESQRVQVVVILRPKLGP